MDSRKDNRKKGKPTEYLVLWEGYLDEEETWKKYENIQRTAEEALAEYKHKQQRNVCHMRLDALGAPGAGARYFAKSFYMTDAPTRPLVQAERSFPPLHRRIMSVCRLPQPTFI